MNTAAGFSCEPATKQEVRKMNQVIIPENYHSVLSMYETQDAIGIIKEMMQKKLCMALRLKRVTAPLFVDPASGLNDDLNGVERPVSLKSRQLAWRHRLYILWQNGNVWRFTAMIFVLERGF